MNKNILVKKANKKQLIILFIIVAAIASISYSKFYSKKAEKTKDDTEKQTIDLNSKEYDMSRNKEYIEDLFSAQKVKKWKKLTLLEKRMRLEYIIKNQCVKLGMETVPPLILSETQDSDGETASTSIIAQYSKTEDCIRINLDYVNNYPRTSMSALCHEMRHRYQVMQVSLYDKLKKDKKYKDYMNMEMFEDVKIYKKEIKNYKTDYTDSQEEYRQQEVEKDANEYAGHQMSEYLRFLVK